MNDLTNIQIWFLIMSSCFISIGIWESFRLLADRFNKTKLVKVVDITLIKPTETLDDFIKRVHRDNLGIWRLE